MALRRGRAFRMVRAQLRPAWLLFFAVVLFAGTARAGSRYFFCSMMGEARAEPCCHHTAGPTPQIDASDCACCSAHVDELPRGTKAAAAVVPAAPQGGLLPAAAVFAGAPARRAAPAAWSLRPAIGPPPPARFALSMVSRN